ncbi:MAG: site-specific integrase [Clostridia bacterium]|nr:site-specific integrase [Clostridia bacterium]
MVDVCVRKRYRASGAVYEYRFEIASIDGKRKWQTKSGFKTITDARQAGKLALRQYENCGHIVKDQISVADFLEDWIVHDCMVDLKPNTVTNYIKQVRIYLKPALGAYRLKSLTREILQGFILKMYDNGFSFNSLIAIKGVLTKSMNYAVDNHYLVCSPAVRLKIPRYRIPVIPTRFSPHCYISADIMQKVFERFPERSSSFIPLKLGYECGLRLGEVFGLCWEDIDFDNKTIRINRQVQWFADPNRDKEEKLIHNGSAECGKGFWYFSAPKYNSCRTIEISDELTDILKREQVRQERAKVYFGQYYSNYYTDSALLSGSELIYKASLNRISMDESGFPIHLVCVRENGTFISPRTMQHTSRIIKKEIFDNFDFHSLRVTHASMLAGLGVEPKYIQTRLGHTDLELTIKVYERVTDLMAERGRKAINELYHEKL